MTTRDRVTAEPWPDLEAFLAWAKGQPERPLMENIERWRAEREQVIRRAAGIPTEQEAGQ